MAGEPRQRARREQQVAMLHYLRCDHEAQPAEMATGRTQSGKVDTEVGEKPRARWRDFRGFVAERDVLARRKKIGEVHAETTGKVVVANSGRTEFPCLT